MECRCGKRISRYMKGTCMACRYRARVQKEDEKAGGEGEKKLKIIVDVAKLPKPYLPPTLPMKIGEVVPDYQTTKYSDFHSDYEGEEARERQRRGAANNHLTRPYTKDEDEKILIMAAEGMTCSMIAAKLDRRPAGVKQRINKLKRREKET